MECIFRAIETFSGPWRSEERDPSAGQLQLFRCRKHSGIWMPVKIKSLCVQSLRRVYLLKGLILLTEMDWVRIQRADYTI